MLNMYKGRLDVFCSILIIKSLLRRSSRFCILHYVILYFFSALQYNFSLSEIVQRLCSRKFEGFVFDGHIVIASGKNAPECHLHFLSFYGCLQIRLQFHVKHFKCE